MDPDFTSGRTRQDVPAGHAAIGERLQAGLPGLIANLHQIDPALEHGRDKTESQAVTSEGSTESLHQDWNARSTFAPAELELAHLGLQARELRFSGIRRTAADPNSFCIEMRTFESATELRMKTIRCKGSNPAA
jgi:hypothetical protein